jgi:hypothetical protein
MTRAKNLQKLLKKVQNGFFDIKFDAILDQMSRLGSSLIGPKHNQQ